MRTFVANSLHHRHSGRMPNICNLSRILRNSARQSETSAAISNSFRRTFVFNLIDYGNGSGAHAQASLKSHDEQWSQSTANELPALFFLARPLHHSEKTLISNLKSFAHLNSRIKTEHHALCIHPPSSLCSLSEMFMWKFLNVLLILSAAVPEVSKRFIIMDVEMAQIIIQTIPPFVCNFPKMHLLNFLCAFLQSQTSVHSYHCMVAHVFVLDYRRGNCDNSFGARTHRRTWEGVRVPPQHHADRMPANEAIDISTGGNASTQWVVLVRHVPFVYEF